MRTWRVMARWTEDLRSDWEETDWEAMLEGVLFF